MRIFYRIFISIHYYYNLIISIIAIFYQKKDVLSKSKNIVKYAVEKSKFYREKFEGIDLEIKNLNDFKKLPITEKNELKEALKKDSLLTNYSNKFKSGYTTGSSGSPLKMYVDSKSIKIKQQFQIISNFKNGINPIKKNVKIWRKKSNTKYESILEKAGLYLKIDIADIDNPSNSPDHENDLKNIVDNLIRFKPQIIRGYVSSLVLIAKYLKKNKISISSLESIISSAETLDEKNFELFKKVFNCNIINMYGGTEAPYVACSSKTSKHLKISNDLYFIEVVDANGNDVFPGETGDILVTDLYNTAMPIIRYKIGDRASVLESINQKFGDQVIYLRNIAGRIDDDLYLNNGRTKILSHFWYIIFRNQEWVEQFQIIQKSDLDLKIKYITLKKDDENFFKIKSKLKELYPEIKFSWQEVQKLDKINGKLKNIISLKNE